MIISRSVLLLILALVHTVQACSMLGGGQQQEDELLASQDEDEDEDEDDENEDSNQEEDFQQDAANDTTNADLNAMIDGMNSDLGMAGDAALTTGDSSGLPASMDSVEPVTNSFAAPAAATPPTGARVYYVLPGGASLLTAPSGQKVKVLPQGEPCLATIEGEWANVINRGYVRISEITESPVGRVRRVKSWN